jgi:hypothetical protein
MLFSNRQKATTPRKMIGWKPGGHNEMSVRLLVMMTVGDMPVRVVDENRSSVLMLYDRGNTARWESCIRQRWNADLEVLGRKP